jgi:hypothetical protein
MIPPPPKNERTPPRPSAADLDHSPLLVFYEVTQACDLICHHCRACAQAAPHPAELTTTSSRRLIEYAGLASFAPSAEGAAPEPMPSRETRWRRNPIALTYPPLVPLM